MIWIPRTTFGRTALLLATTLVAGMIGVFLLLRLYVAGPGAQTIAGLLASHLSILSEYLAPGTIYGSRDQLLQQLETQGWRIVRGAEPPPVHPADGLYSRRLEALIQQRHGIQVSMHLDTSDRSLLWMYVAGQEPLWISIPFQPLKALVPPILAAWLVGIALLSFAGAAFAARHVNRPLRDLALAASRIGRGETPACVDIGGPAEIQALASAFNRMAAEVNQLGRDRTLLLAGVSHDLRTPLTRLRLAAEMVAPYDAELSDGMAQDVEDMEAIIAQFMAFIREGRSEPRIATTLNALVERVARREVPAEVQLDLALEPTPPVHLRVTAMRRLITNLIENAVQHGAGAPVQVRLERTPTHLRLRIRDQGPGIPDDEDSERLFEPFVRAESARSGRGSGLGLTIAQRIAHMHGGSIRLRNAPQGGAEVVLELPAPPDDPGCSRPTPTAGADDQARHRVPKGSATH